MSFSDFGGSPAAPPKSSGDGVVVPPSSAAAANNPLSIISDTLLQYQSNVDILANIVQGLNLKNMDMFQTQNDVLQQLEEKILRQIQQQQSSNAVAVEKLQRDFQRVQTRARQLQESATKNISTAAKQTAGGAEQQMPQHQQRQQQQQQIQLQEDRLQEEIMRERETEIRNINRGMNQVNEIYKDLANIVASQQDHVDAIETQMEESKVNAESGLRQVQQANEKYGNGGQCRVM